MSTPNQPKVPSACHWRLVVTPAGRGAWNMAVDETLMSVARDTGNCILRVYGWSPPTLSLGRNQSAQGRYDLQKAVAMGIDIVRRPTGGRAVLHDREITYSVAAPVIGLGSLKDSYNRINALLAFALGTLGADTQIVTARARAPLPGIAPCFETPTTGELTAQGRKLVGSAQWRDQGALLQHGSILIANDQARITDLLIEQIPPSPQPATLKQLLGRTPTLEEMAEALATAVVTLEDAGASPWKVEELPSATLDRAVARFDDESWTWRR